MRKTGLLFIVLLLLIQSAWAFGEGRYQNCPAGLTNPLSKTFATIFDNGNSGSAKTIDWSAGNVQKLTTTHNCTLSFSNVGTYYNSLLLLVQHDTSSTAFTYTWPTTIKWAGGVAATTTNTAGAWDMVLLVSDGANVFGFAGMNDFKTAP